MIVHPLESSGKRNRSVRGAVPSIAVHAAIVLVAVHATAHAAVSPDRPTPPPVVHYVPNTPAPPAEHHRARSDAGSTGSSSIDPAPLHVKPVSWPITVPDHLPVVDASRSTTTVDRSEFGVGVKTGTPFGSGNAASGAAPMSAADVERPVSPIGAAAMPAYPEALRSSGVRGSVTAEFVVDTTGRVEPASFRALGSDNDLFTAAVRTAVLRTRFHPAEAGGRRVRQLVQESFSFVLQ